MSQHDFHVFCFSNSSMDIYPENSASKFTVKLPKELDLREGEWQCGIVDLSVPRIEYFKYGVKAIDEIIFPHVNGLKTIAMGLPEICRFILANSTRPDFYLSDKKYFINFLEGYNIQKKKIPNSNPKADLSDDDVWRTFSLAPFPIRYGRRLYEPNPKQYVNLQSGVAYTLKEIIYKFIDAFLTSIENQTERVGAFLAGNEMMISSADNEMVAAIPDELSTPILRGAKSADITPMMFTFVETFIQAIMHELQNEEGYFSHGYMMVYSSIVAPSIIFDSLSRIIFITRQKPKKEIPAIPIDRVKYFNVESRLVQEISFLIMSERGQQVRFQSSWTGTAISLHFKRIA